MTALTIGFFDGVHLGHQFLLKELCKHPHTTILTFSNHPRAFFNPPGPKLILSLEERLARLKPYADVLDVVPFDAALANTPFEAILDKYRPSTLILGEGAVFGKNRQGTPENIRAYGVNAIYLPKLTLNGFVVSSSHIRTLLGIS